MPLDLLFMDTSTLVTVAVVLLVLALVGWLWRKRSKVDPSAQSPIDGDEASAPEGAFGAVVPESTPSSLEADTQPLSTQPPDFADTETSGPDTVPNTQPAELTEEESQSLLKRLQEAALLDAQEAAQKQTEQKAREEAQEKAQRESDMERAALAQKAAQEQAAAEQALLAQERAQALRDAELRQQQALAAQQAQERASKEKLAAEAAREKALLEKLRAERLERERLQREQLAQEQAQKEQEAQAARQAEEEHQRLLQTQTQMRTEAVPPAAEKTPPAAPYARRAADFVVMVADDSKVVRVKASRLLAKHQYQVLLAEDGTDAAAQMQNTLPDLLITDVEMPGMDGFELTRHLRSNARTAHIPVIMITAADDRHQAAAQEAGVNVLLGKPYEDEDLISRIKSTLRAA